jgi:putative AbiEii toxin of type IV toxin-antitoxin system
MHEDSQGSVWRRWDPHLHTPGTILNDRFLSADPWEEYLQRIENSEPLINALGVTDYCSIDVYERVRQYKIDGRLPDVGLIFPNVELRLATGTGRDSAINLHLLVSPDDPDHVAQTRRFLLSLVFKVKGEPYRCERSDLIRLGKAHDSSITDDGPALAVGTNQFKVAFEDLRKAWNDSQWARDNILIAVAGGSNDGTSGIQNDPGFAAMRKEIEGFAHIIFSAQPKQRAFWLGRGAATIEQLNAGWGGCKPCIHGSDAHDLDTVGQPALQRFCWIKGDLSFESLHQAYIEPDGRSFIGPAPPTSALPSQIITSITLSNAPWVTAAPIPLNPGLVAIIGARGSGKTALADLIGAGASAGQWLNKRSFLYRAKNLLAGSSVALSWADGQVETTPLHPDAHDDWRQPMRVRYLSQQFVEQLCSAEGLTDELLAEIERVIFQAHPFDARFGATSFRELLNLKAARPRAACVREQAAFVIISNALLAERAKKASLIGLQKQQQDQAAAISVDKKNRQSIMPAVEGERSHRLNAVSVALDAARSRLDRAARRQQALLALQDEIVNTRQNSAPAQLRQWQVDHAEAALTPEQWKLFLLTFSGDVDAILKAELDKASCEVDAIRGPAVAHVSEERLPTSQPLIADNADLAQQTTSCLEAELARLRGLAGIDSENSRKLTRLSDKITQAEAELLKTNLAITEAQQADDRISQLISERIAIYERIFTSIIEEESQLSELYAPLQMRLQTQSGSLGKLSFSVRRQVDVAAWAAAGEQLLDLRKNGPFRLRGTLLAQAKTELEPAWRSGSAAEIAAAMLHFRQTHEEGLLQHIPEDVLGREARHAWGRRISEWLHSSAHVSIAYSIQYDGVEIEQLSQGTRGIVLLLLYLAIDQDDDRPLIIDQPEENLDPRSIFVELVKSFREAKLRRQIIIVTHNANLVVNTDADQVIVATCGPHMPGQLPAISYLAGGLENPTIRQVVCDILEGGETAFRERARRLRVSL